MEDVAFLTLAYTKCFNTYIDTFHSGTGYQYGCGACNQYFSSRYPNSGIHFNICTQNHCRHIDADYTYALDAEYVCDKKCRNV